ncbi:MAG: hypothetical protein QXQ94_10195 [Candidatus Bathyarchaeia archaeon]
MPLLKKVMDINGSTVVVLPKQYTDAFEKIHGVKLKQVLMEVNNEIVIKPYIPPTKPVEAHLKEKEPIEIGEIEEVF